MALRRRGARGRRESELFPGFNDIVEIGIGSLALVYRAREPGTGRQVALKLLNLRDASPRAIESFERESIALGALSAHPNIVTLYRTFRTPDGRPVLVLELCTGAVAERIHAGTGMPVADAVSIGIKIAGALETAHRAGILHRDVKPQNILVTEFGEPALADFGVAMLQSATQTTAGLFDFTTLHAAPELLEGGGTSAATDVYELASSLYQLIAGQSAFRAYEGESPASVILRILRDPVRPLSVLPGTDVPVALSQLLIRAMSKDKDQRPPTAAEFAAELAEVEIAQGWHRTQFLVRDAGPSRAVPAVIRMPDAVPRVVVPEAPPAEPAEHVVEPAAPVNERVEQDWSTPTLVAAADAPSAVEIPQEQPPTQVAPTDWDRFVAPSFPARPATEPPPETPAPPHPRRVRVDIDDEFFPARRPPGAELEPAPPAPPPPPAPPRPDTAGAVPVWVVRAPAEPTPGPAPKFSADYSLDPATLRSKLTIRSGVSSVRVDERQLRLRTWLRTARIPWTDVHGFEAHEDDFADGPFPTGFLVALTSAGPIELPATKKPMAEVHYLHALLDACHARAKRQ